MSGPEQMSASDASRNLARLVERRMGFTNGHIDPVALRLFIVAYWKRVAAFAHAIHKDQA
jgi:hypothetical protein